MKFSLWVHEMWYNYLREMEAYNQPSSRTSQEYFNANKWWLRKEYRLHNKADH